MDTTEGMLDKYKENKCEEKMLVSATSRIDELVPLIAYLNNPDRVNQTDYSDLLTTVCARMKKISMRVKGILDNNLYNDVVKHGWIEKRSGNNQTFKTWKKMWFILKPTELHYYVKDRGLTKKSLSTSSGALQTAAQPPAPQLHLEAELGKKKEGKAWKVRWVKLWDTKMEIYRTQRDQEILRTFDIKDIEWCDVYKDMSKRFVVSVMGVKYYFQTITKDDLYKWVEAIKERIAWHKKQRTQLSMDLTQFALKGIIYLGNINSIQDCTKFNSQQHCIGLVTEKRCTFLSFDSAEEKGEWLACIQEQLTKNNPLVATHGGQDGAGDADGTQATAISTPASMITPLTSSLHSTGSDEEAELGSHIPKKRSQTSFAALPHSDASGSGSAKDDDGDSGDEADSNPTSISLILKNEILRRSTHNLLNTFKLEVYVPMYPELETSTFLFSDSVLVEQAKHFIYKKIPQLQTSPVDDYRLGLDEETLLEVEFLKFMYCNTMIELALNTCGIVKIGIFNTRRGSRDRLTVNHRLAATRPSMRMLENTSSSPTLNVPVVKDDSSPAGNTTGGRTSPAPSPTWVDASPRTPSPSMTVNIPPPQMYNESAAASTSLSVLPSPNLLLSAEPMPTLNLSVPAAGTSSSPPRKLSHKSRRMSATDLQAFVTLKKSPLMQSCSGWTIEPVTTANIDFDNLILNKPHTSFYRKCILDCESVQSYLGEDSKVGPVAFSLVKDFVQDVYRGILHTKLGVKTCALDCKTINFGNIAALSKALKKRKIISHLVHQMDSRVDCRQLRLAPNQSGLQKELLTLEERQTTSGFKFGLVVCKDDQGTDDEIFSNRSGSQEYEEFLGLMGTKIELMGWPNYSAGLDVRANTTGTHSLYTDFKGNEVMFHVSTMLPYCPGDPQQIERKRQVGNDICVIIYNDGSQSYVPSTITSHFNHIVIVVQFDRINDSYKVSVATKDQVESFEPPVPQSVKREQLREYIITKLINGEMAALQAPVFFHKITRTRETLLKYFIEQYSHHAA
ncbi:hypothetical protein SAMD00019534_013200 [Acytostelium subglobosum LB1]|uniref:hypothetical protein n=1 Tax=Acytostelium subglobosum LB1 TaxID=1410327 RepID=UPI000644FE01|nr:hypothetical protein SAMD00019534_013200 [Acytostelium subglobosum LB1]GAM18145.1 hypothetical protein SAMD00019534_013200 [Acytostelium subglobosum LB1]|eukprot:XP_012758741.1 hypothetical protein SAMD00019534_013200 [Acytostelium subglobosum LB1]